MLLQLSILAATQLEFQSGKKPFIERKGKAHVVYKLIGFPGLEILNYNHNESGCNRGFSKFQINRQTCSLAD